MVLETHYEVLCTLGEGAFGKVYKAKHRETGEDVAAKEIKLGSRSFDEACNSMELKALKALRHPCVVRLRELLRSQRDGSLFFIFEFIGSDLSSLIEENPRGLAEGHAVELTRQLLVGLCHIHQVGFFHRDIKPANILLDPVQQTIRIADFGETRSLRARPPFTDYVGTRWYRAPECLLRNNFYSSPVDVWAAGLVFAELLRGSTLFMGSSGIDQLNKIFAVLGVPDLRDWPEFKQLVGAIHFHVDQVSGVEQVLPNVSSEVHLAMAGILTLNPGKRPAARRCLEQMEVFAKLPPLDMQRGDPNGFGRPSLASAMTCNFPESNVASRPSFATGMTSVFPDQTDKETPNLPEQTDVAPPSPARASRMSVNAWEFHQEVDLDAELDEILADSPKQVRTADRNGFDNPNQASITGMLNAFSLEQGEADLTTPRKDLRDQDVDVAPPHRAALPHPPLSPSSGMDAILASLEANLQ